MGPTDKRDLEKPAAAPSASMRYLWEYGFGVILQKVGPNRTEPN